MNLPTENYIWIANSFALKDLKLSDFIQYILFIIWTCLILALSS